MDRTVITNEGCTVLPSKRLFCHFWEIFFKRFEEKKLVTECRGIWHTQTQNRMWWVNYSLDTALLTTSLKCVSITMKTINWSNDFINGNIRDGSYFQACQWNFVKSIKCVTIQSVDETLVCDHSNKSYWGVLSCGAVNCAIQGCSNFFSPYFLSWSFNITSPYLILAQVSSTSGYLACHPQE